MVEGGKIVIDVIENSSIVFIYVKDIGIGIS